MISWHINEQRNYQLPISRLWSLLTSHNLGVTERRVHEYYEYILLWWYVFTVLPRKYILCPKFYFCLSKLWTWPELKINSQVGGSMGLWLGLGVIQAIQLLVQYILPFLRRKTQKNETRGNKHKEPIKVSTWNSWELCGGFYFFQTKFERHQITEQNLHRLLPVTIYYEVSI